jgi:hypothetical protein
MRALIIAIGLAAALITTSGVAHADSGTFTQDDGPTCSWSSFGSSASMDCSGYSRSAGGYVSYHCEYQFSGFGSYSYQCRDQRGNRWQGSR